MDVELQILKHLARESHPTVGIIDESCADYKADRARNKAENQKIVMWIFLIIRNGTVNLDVRISSIICVSLCNHYYYFG
jgi:hypothetical protein